MAASYTIELLGGLRVRGGGREVAHFRTQKAAGLLAFLALHPGRTHPREELADRFWPDADHDAGRMNLRAALASLRRDLGEDAETGATIHADRQSVSLDTARVTTDVAQFEDALRRAEREADSAEKAAHLTRAVALYRGALLPGFYDDWVLAERERLQARQVRALRELVAALTAEGQRDRALAYAHQAVALEPLDEEGYADILRLYAAGGQFAALTRQYKELTRRLRDDLDADPSPALRRLYERLLQERPALIVTEERPAAPPSAPAVPAPPARRRVLPAPLTRFFGREAELETVLALLRDRDDGTPPARLVTLTGTGGTGKTRLATEAGRKFAAQAPNASTVFVPLADVTDGDLLPGALLKALEFAPETSVSPCERLLSAVAPFDGLLILDNLEQIAGDAAGLIPQMLQAAPRLRILATSRMPLGIGGEREFPVPPLTVARSADPNEPPEALPGVQLFLDRARAVRPDLPMNRENAAILSAICERLDGLPLALELAAAWAQTLTPAQILTGLNDRFRLLTSRRKDAPERHRSLRSAVEWSFQTLEPGAQTFFVRLSAFRGGATLESAAAICEEPNALEYMALLQERSLVAAAPDGAEMRFRLLETLREYGRTQLTAEEQEALSRRHADYFLRFAQERRKRLDTPRQGEMLNELESEYDNCRAALEGTLAAPGAAAAEVAAALAVALFRFWTIRGYIAEGRRWLNRILAREAELSGSLRAHIWYFAGSCALEERDYDEAERLFTEAMAQMAALGDGYGVINSLTRLGLIAYGREDFAAAETIFREALAQTQTGDFPDAEGHVLKCLGMTLTARGDFAEARKALEEGMKGCRASGSPHSISMMLGELGNLAMCEGDFDEAEAYLEEQIELARPMKAVSHERMGLERLLQIALKRRDASRAVPFAQRLTELCRESGDAAGQAQYLLQLAALQLRRDETVAASASLQEASALAKQSGDKTALRQSLAVAAALAARRGDAADAERLRQQWQTPDPSGPFWEPFLDESVTRRERDAESEA